MDADKGHKGQLTASAARGLAPLAVRFYADGGGKVYFGGVWLEFGDGQKTMACAPGAGCREICHDHVYAAAGAYEVRLVAQGESESQLLGALRVEVTP